MATPLPSSQGILEYRRRTLGRLLNYAFGTFLVIVCIRSSLLLFVEQNMIGYLDLAIQANAAMFCRISLMLLERGRFQLIDVRLSRGDISPRLDRFVAGFKRLRGAG